MLQVEFKSHSLSVICWKRHSDLWVFSRDVEMNQIVDADMDDAASMQRPTIIDYNAMMSLVHFLAVAQMKKNILSSVTCLI